MNTFKTNETMQSSSACEPQKKKKQLTNDKTRVRGVGLLAHSVHIDDDDDGANDAADINNRRSAELHHKRTK